MLYEVITRFNQWYHASLADFFSMIHYRLLGGITQRYYGEKSVGIHNTLIQAIPGLIVITSYSIHYTKLYDLH